MLKLLVKGDKPVVSYVPAMTGLSEAKMAQAVPFAEVQKQLLALLPPKATLIGEGVSKVITRTHYPTNHPINQPPFLACIFSWRRACVWASFPWRLLTSTCFGERL